MATLLVAVVGATFAYFTATNDASGAQDSTTNVTTEQIGGTTFTLAQDGSLKQDKLNYPGGISLIKVVATAKKDSHDDENSYDFSYNLKVAGTSTVQTQLNWHLYALDESTQSSLEETLGEKFGINSCKLVSDTQTEGETHYYYTTDGTAYSGEVDNTKDCTAKNLGIDTQLNTYEIAGGTFASTGLTDNKGSAESIEQSIKGVSDETGKKMYYYLVIEYPNNEDSQASDMGQTVNLTLSLVENSVTAEVATEG